MSFAKWFPIKAVDAFVVDDKTMIRPHVDYALMALFGAAFYGSSVELPVVARWRLAIGASPIRPCSPSRPSIPISARMP